MYKKNLTQQNLWIFQECPVALRNALSHGPHDRCVKLRVAHAPGMPGTFSPPSTSKETASERSRRASRHVRHARAVMHVGIANARWREKRSRHSQRMRNLQFCVSGKRHIVWELAETSKTGAFLKDLFHMRFFSYNTSIWYSHIIQLTKDENCSYHFLLWFDLASVDFTRFLHAYFRCNNIMNDMVQT